MMEHWLDIIVGVYLLIMILYGHYRGAIRMAVSVTAVLITTIAVHVATPYVETFIRENTPVNEWVKNSISEAVGIDRLSEALPETQLPAAQRQFIENMQLPENIKELLIENNNNEIYKALGVDAFAEYIGNYLAGLIIHFVSFVVLFVLIYAGLRLAAYALDLVAKLPVLSGINQVAGAVLGGLHGLFFIWLAALLITAFGAMPWAASILAEIEASPWLSFLYNCNLLSWLAMRILNGLIV